MRYDGKINQIPVKNIFLKDVAAGLEVGKLVRVKWGATTWQGVLVGLPRDPSKVQCGDTCTYMYMYNVCGLVVQVHMHDWADIHAHVYFWLCTGVHVYTCILLTGTSS